MDTVETDRLILRPFTPTDGPSMHLVIGNDPDMTWEKTSWPLETTEQLLGLRLKHYAEHGFGVWAMINKHTGEMIGQAGLQVLEGSREVELVVYTAKRFWHQGIGLEACTAALKYGFGDMHLSKIVAVTRVNNMAGQRLTEKLGFQYLRDSTAYGFDVRYYELLRRDFVPQIDGSYRVCHCRD